MTPDEQLEFQQLKERVNQLEDINSRRAMFAESNLVTAKCVTDPDIAVARIEKIESTIEKTVEYIDGFNVRVRRLEEDVNLLQPNNCIPKYSETPNYVLGGWIPVSNAMPVVSKYPFVLVSTKDDGKTKLVVKVLDSTWLNNLKYSENMDCGVVAWMPLPEPYDPHLITPIDSDI